MKLYEIEARVKAGIIPYVRQGDTIKMLFMISSDADYGGTAPQISKGGVDKGESVQNAAIREGEEELGLRKQNIISNTLKPAWTETVSGMTASYVMHVYAAEVRDIDAFDTPGYETASVVWLTPQEFYQQGRKGHAKIVRAVEQFLQQ